MRPAFLAALVLGLGGCPQSEPDAPLLRSAASLIEEGTEQELDPDAGMKSAGGPMEGAPEDVFVVEGLVQPEKFEWIGWEVPGTVGEVFVKAGDQVRAGDVLGQLSTDERQGRLDEARGEFDKAIRSLPAARRSTNVEKPPEYLLQEMRARLALVEQDAAQVQADLQRFRREAARGGEQAARDFVANNSRRRVRRPAMQSVKRANEERLNRELAQELDARMRKLEFALASAELKSPIDGVVVDVNVSPGDEWSTRGDAPAFEVVDPRALVVRAVLPVHRARLLVEQEPVWIELVVGTQKGTIAGTVLEVADEPRYVRQRDGSLSAVGREVAFKLSRGVKGLAVGDTARIAILE